MFSTMDAYKEACGYYVYNAISSNSWRRVAVYKEVGNTKDRYAISVLQGPDVVGHLPQKIYRIDTSGS